LREDILAGRLQPGLRLVEGDLTARFAVSRGPVREGLRRLTADGLIEHWPHRGAIVRRLTEREIRELFSIRIEMEALAARLAAAADAADRRARFVAAIEPVYADAPRNPCDYLKENAAFHDAVMALADNLQLRDLAARLQLPLIMAQVGDVLTPPVLEASVREHRLIAEAILDRDPAAASARMREHLERAAPLALAKRATQV
jgi:DNA-binding GntR family transcriptional regulator